MLDIFGWGWVSHQFLSSLEMLQGEIGGEIGRKVNIKVGSQHRGNRVREEGRDGNTAKYFGARQVWAPLATSAPQEQDGVGEGHDQGHDGDYGFD